MLSYRELSVIILIFFEFNNCFSHDLNSSEYITNIEQYKITDSYLLNDNIKNHEYHLINTDINKIIINQNRNKLSKINYCAYNLRIDLDGGESISYINGEDIRSVLEFDLSNNSFSERSLLIRLKNYLDLGNFIDTWEYHNNDKLYIKNFSPLNFNYIKLNNINLKDINLINLRIKDKSFSKKIIQYDGNYIKEKAFISSDESIYIPINSPTNSKIDQIYLYISKNYKNSNEIKVTFLKFDNGSGHNGDIKKESYYSNNHNSDAYSILRRNPFEYSHIKIVHTSFFNASRSNFCYIPETNLNLIKTISKPAHNNPLFEEFRYGNKYIPIGHKYNYTFLKIKKLIKNQNNEFEYLLNDLNIHNNSANLILKITNLPPDSIIYIKDIANNINPIKNSIIKLSDYNINLLKSLIIKTSSAVQYDPFIIFYNEILNKTTTNENNSIPVYSKIPLIIKDKINTNSDYIYNKGNLSGAIKRTGTIINLQSTETILGDSVLFYNLQSSSDLECPLKIIDLNNYNKQYLLCNNLNEITLKNDTTKFNNINISIISNSSKQHFFNLKLDKRGFIIK